MVGILAFGATKMCSKSKKSMDLLFFNGDVRSPLGACNALLLLEESK